MRRRFLVEPLEGRQMLSTFMVNSTADTTAMGTLPWAITQSNSTTGPNTIDFDIPDSSENLLEIELSTPLPPITTPVNINGFSEYPSGAPEPTPLIQIDGTDATAISVGLQFQKSASGTATTPIQVSGLEITDFSGGVVSPDGGGGVFLDGASYVDLDSLTVGVRDPGYYNYVEEGDGNYGVEISQATEDILSTCVVSANHGPGVIVSDASDTTLSNDWIGTGAYGSLSLGNNGDGILIESGASDTSVTQTDVVANNGQGVEITGSGTEHNSLTEDFIGDEGVGSSPMPNQQNGVQITGSASDNTIGGTGFGSGNVISGNMGDGVDLNGSGVTGNLVAGNDIGTDSNSDTGLGNYDGVEIENAATDNTVGGTTSAARNVISGNNWDGVHIVDTGTMDNLVEGNFIGVTVGGSGALGNVQSGVAIYAGASANTIGGTVSAAGNVLSGNDSNGVYISDSGTTGNVVDADYIGTNYNGTSAVPNNTGVVIQNGATGNLIGGTTTAVGDVISGNDQDGVDILDSNTEKNAVEGDDIGLAFGDSATLENGGNGVAIYESASDNTIGGSVTGAGDVISGNMGDGVDLNGSGVTGNLVAGNDIGTDSNSDTGLGNYDGVEIENAATYNTIGGTTTAARNVISGNNWDGVHIVDTATKDNLVEGNYIGVNIGGSAPLGNVQSGVAIYAGASANTIGGTVSAAGNVLSGNDSNGVYISDSGTTGNVVDADYIGTNYKGTSTVANNTGVVVQNRAAGNVIGGTTTATADVISGNMQDGVDILDNNTTGNAVEGSDIGVTTGASAPWPTGATAWPSTKARATTRSAGR